MKFSSGEAISVFFTVQVEGYYGFRCQIFPDQQSEKGIADKWQDDRSWSDTTSLFEKYSEVISVQTNMSVY